MIVADRKCQFVKGAELGRLYQLDSEPKFVRTLVPRLTADSEFGRQPGVATICLEFLLLPA
jgi:hypothetical protein